MEITTSFQFEALGLHFPDLDATAATSAAPRPLPSSDSIRSNYTKN